MVRRLRFIKLLAVISIVMLLLQACSAGTTAQQNSVTSDKQKQSNKAPVTVTVGYQSPTAQTWGALIIKNKKLFEKHLQELVPDQNVKVEWFDAPAGSILNNNMVGGKIQISFLGDMPSLLNGVLGITQANYHSVFLSFDGKGVEGRNQAILVPKNSSINSIEDLKGKTVSTPIGSSSHRMLLESLRKHNLVDQVTIVDQSVTVGMQSIEQDKIAAHSTWEPYPSLMQQRNIGKVLQFGEDTHIDYLAGVVANLDWAKANKPVVTAFLAALNEAHEFAAAHPGRNGEDF